MKVRNEMMGSQKPGDAQMTGLSGHFASPAAEPKRASVTGRRARGMDEGVCEETALRKRAVANEYGLAVCQDGGGRLLI